MNEKLTMLLGTFGLHTAPMKKGTSTKLLRRSRIVARDRLRLRKGEATMNALRTAIAGLTLLFGATLVRADVITEWNRTATAIMNVAMSDAVNSVHGRYTRFIAQIPLASNASADAAASAAAKDMLLRLFPSQKARIEEFYAVTLKGIPDGAAKSTGIAVGEQIGAAVYADRSNDAINMPDSYRPITTPGVWIPTTPPLFPQYATAKPWGVKGADQFRPGPPPQLSSALYARDYNETRALGGMTSSKRTPQQSEAVRFWSAGTFARSWNEAASQLSGAKGFDLADNARLFALLTVGIADVTIADRDAKFHYNFWRPVTAIRNGDRDDNGATERDAGWLPSTPTPMSPEYPSGAAIIGGVAAAVLESVFGARSVPRFAITDIADSRVTREFDSIAKLAEEQREVRIWGGIHFRNSLEVGDAMGRKIAEQLVANYLKPAR